MKTNILKNMLIIVMAAMAMPMMAQDNNYVNVNLKDGNNNKFLLKDINEIYTSKTDADGKQNDDYQFQYVTTADGDFIYDLDDIDCLEFVKSEEEIPDETAPWYMVALPKEGEPQLFDMSTVGGFVAIDNAYDFSVLDTDGGILAEGVKKAFFMPADEIDPTNIRPAAQARNLLARPANGKLTLIGVSGEVNVYDTNGLHHLTVTANGDETVVNIAHLPAGIYVAKSGKLTFKFTKK